MGLALSLPLMSPMGAPQPPLLSTSSCCGHGGANTLPAYLLHSCCLGGRDVWGEWGRCLPSLPPPKSDASGSKILLLEVPGELQGAFSLCMPPRSGAAVGGQGRARGWWLRRGREESQGGCQGLGGSLARACSWHVLLSRAQAEESIS